MGKEKEIEGRRLKAEPHERTEKKMNGTICAFEERNNLVEQYLWCIDSVIRQNYTLVLAAHLDRDDVRQALAVRLIQAVDRYDPNKGCSLKSYIFKQLKYELLTCNSPQMKFGIKDAPYSLRGVVISMEALAESNPYWESTLAA